MFLSKTKDNIVSFEYLKNSSFKKVRRIHLTKLKNSQLRAIFNQLELDVIEANKKLISLLINKDSLYVEQDSYLIDIEKFRNASANNSNKMKEIRSSSFFSNLKNFTSINSKIDFAKQMKSESDSSDEDESLEYNSTCEEILNKLGKFLKSILMFIIYFYF